MSQQEESTLTPDQVTAQELALVQQMRTLEIRREQYVPRQGGQAPLSLIKYDNRRYLEVRQGFQPILVPDHMVTIVRSFLAENLPQHIRTLRDQAQSPPGTPMSMSSVASTVIARDLRLPPAFGSLHPGLLGSQFQPAEPVSPPYSYPTSAPMAALGSPSFDQFSNASEPLSPEPDELGSPSQVAPSLPYYEPSSLFTTVPGQGIYDQTSAAASFMSSLSGIPLPSTPATVAGSLGLMSSPPPSLSSSYSTSHDLGSSLLALPTTGTPETAAALLPPLSLAGSIASTSRTRKVSASAQRKASRTMVRKQNSMPYLDTGAGSKQDLANPRIQELRSDANDSAMDVDDGYDDNISTTSSSNKEAGNKVDPLLDDDDDQPLRKPPNAFILYRRMKNEKLRSERPGISVETASGVIGKFWREEPDEVKREFHELANKARDAYFAKKKRLQARQKQKKLEREEQQQLQQKEQANPGSDSQPAPKAKRKTSKSLSSPPPSLVISTSRNLSSFSPESLAKKVPTSAGFQEDVGAPPPVRATRSLSDTYNNGSGSKQILRESLTMPSLSTFQQQQHQQQSTGSLSTLLEHSIELGVCGGQLSRSLEDHASSDMELRVSATVATLKQAFDDAQRSQPTSPITAPSALGSISGPQWLPGSQAIEQNEWEGVFNKLFPRSN